MSVDEPRQPRAAAVDEIATAIGAFRGGWVQVAVFSALINLLMLAPALYMLQVYDRVLSSGNETTLWMLTLWVLAAYGVMGLLEWVRSFMVIRLGAQLDLRLSPRVFDAAFERNLRSGRLAANQALADLTSLRQFATGSALFALVDVPWFPVYLLVLGLLHPLLAGLALAGAVALLCLAWLNQRQASPWLEKAGEQSLQAGQQAGANLRNTAAIEAMGMLPALRSRWLAQHRHFLASQNRASERTAVISAVSRALRLGLQSLVLGAGAWLAVENRITPGMMIAGSILMGRVLGPIDQLIGAWKQWTSAQQCYGRLRGLLAAHPARRARMPLPAPRGALALEHVVAAPPGQRSATLRGVRLQLDAGEALGVIGPSGSGKSTLAHVIVGVWPLARGVVRIDGADISGLDRGTLGPDIGYLPQEVELFAGTIAQNIARFAPVDAEAVVQAARLAGVHELILRQPQGYDTVLGERGQGLSGGQKQRVALARAVYGLPALVVLDEPDAHLDEAGESALRGAIDRLRHHRRTLVVVSHKPALLRATDRLLVMRDGRMQRIVATAELLERAAATGIPSAAPAAAKAADGADARRAGGDS